MEKQYLIDDLKRYGQSDPSRNIKILIGKKVLKMIFYLDAASIRGFFVEPQKYYVFISDKGQVFECENPEEAADISLSFMVFDYNEVGIGDCVDFGFYGQFYVCGENISGTKFLVTPDSTQRAKRTVDAFYIDKFLAVEIVEKFCASKKTLA